MSWIRYTRELPGKPEVGLIAMLSGKTIRETVAILLEFWCWADENIVADDSNAESNGCVTHGSRIDLTQIVRDTDQRFWDAMISVGWLSHGDDDDLVIPHFGRWMGESAKKREQNKLRQEEFRKRAARNADSNAGVTRRALPGALQNRDSNAPREREREREREKKKEEKSASPPLSADADPSLPILTSENGHLGPTAEQLIAEWNSVPVVKCARIAGKRRTVLTARNRDPYFREHWRAAIAHVADCPFLCGENDRGWVADIDWFLRPDTMLKIMEGKYDAREPAAKSGFLADLFGEKK